MGIILLLITMVTHMQKKGNVIVEYAKEFWHLLKSGSKQTVNDIKFLSALKKKDNTAWTALDLYESRRIKLDLLKFIPFSFFIIVPAAELVLPFYLIFFPNSVPSTFMFDWQKKERRTLLLEKQREGAIYVSSYVLSALKKHQLITTEQASNISQYGKDIQQALIVNFSIVSKELDLENMDSDLLIQVNHLLAVEVITGTNILTQFVKHSLNMPRYLINLFLMIIRSQERLKWNHWIFNYNFKLNFFPFEPLKRALLLAQIKSQINYLEKEDKALHQFGFTNFEVQQFLSFSLYRGIHFDDKAVIERLIMEDWLAISKWASKDPSLFVCLSALHTRAIYETK
eukprot:TRINITY_DN9473_c0_g1_i1.p1 TRINITY_DN9473_c0_g1~~TRINITY_DN9473_c0_g1_i1.p1  ORF type:complete len:342 (+),score=59.61 TRINITY_DN9473_c0_g1_i1:215-1240(+)